jgi:hypothetical protein
MPYIPFTSKSEDVEKLFKIFWDHVVSRLCGDPITGLGVCGPCTSELRCYPGTTYSKGINDGGFSDTSTSNTTPDFVPLLDLLSLFFSVF